MQLTVKIIVLARMDEHHWKSTVDVNIHLITLNATSLDVQYMFWNINYKMDLKSHIGFHVLAKAYMLVILGTMPTMLL
jgi:hypothetical protein